MTGIFKYITNIRRRACLFSCMLAVAAMGLCLLDGTANSVQAQLTTADCQACHVNLIPEPYFNNGDYHHNYIAPRLRVLCSGCHNNPNIPNNTLSLYRDNCGACHSLQGHEAQHDKTDVPQALCADCHSANVYPEHQNRPAFQNTDGTFNCAVCHDSSSPDVQNAITAGSGPVGQIVFCDDCHTNMTGASSHTAQHDNALVDAPSCLQCHADNVVTEHLDRGYTCSNCHSGETIDLVPAVVLQVINDAVSTNPNPQTRYCTDCHTAFAGHEADHDQGFFLMTPSAQDCTRCHAAMDPAADPNAANLVTEHVTNRGLTCGTCHDKTGHVFEAISKGRSPSNLPVYCVDCHADSGQGEGHAPVTVEPWSECSWCHTIDVYGIPKHNMHQAAARDMQQDCSVCHVPEGTRPDCILCHSLDQTIWDPLPIYRTAPNDSLNIIGPGTEDHDKHTSGISCTYCHVNGVPGSDPLPAPYSECAKCHNAGGPGSDIAFGSNVHTINHIEGAKAVGQGCAYCHSQTPACTDCHAIAGPNMLQHDTHTDTLQYNCAECHVNGIAGSEPLPAPYNECADCHNPTGPGSDIVYGSMIHTNNHIGGGEASGQSCGLCHGPAAPDCSSCHAPGHPPIPAPYNECSTCHNGTGGTKNIVYGQPVHNTHMAAANNNCAICHTAQPNCGACHTAGDHAGAHDNVGAPSTGCLKCHDANVVVEHVDNRNFSCADCHGNPAYAEIIEKGKTDLPANFVSCYDCHGQNNHHATTESQSGNCTHCHADPRLEIDPNAPTGQLACRQCHGTNMHGKGGPIQDYGACFSCHQPTPYHAKPTSWPGWYEENQKAPGRGKFSLFKSTLMPQCAGDCEDTPLENRSGYGEDSQPERINDGNWRNPSLTFNMVTIFDSLGTNKNWTVPTFGSTGGGGTPPPQNDSVNITRAEYDREKKYLEVRAENALGNKATLSVLYNNKSYQMNWNSDKKRWEIKISSSGCYDSTIEVVSSAGGSDSSSVSNCSTYSGGWSWSR